MMIDDRCNQIGNQIGTRIGSSNNSSDNGSREFRVISQPLGL